MRGTNSFGNGVTDQSGVINTGRGAAGGEEQSLQGLRGL